jgi:hypothetical protein
MPIDTSALDRDLQTITADLPATITVGGTPYSVSAADEGIQQDLDLAGYNQDFSVEFCVRIAVLAIPAVGTKVAYKSRLYVVDRTTPSPDGVSYQMTCKYEGKR